MIIPYTLWEAIVVGLRSSVAYGFYAYLGTILALATWYGILSLTPRRKLQKALDQAEGMKDIVHSLKSRMWDMQSELEHLRAENEELRTLIREDVNHSKAWRVRAHAVLQGRD